MSNGYRHTNLTNTFLSICKLMGAAQAHYFIWSRFDLILPFIEWTIYRAALGIDCNSCSRLNCWKSLLDLYEYFLLFFSGYLVCVHCLFIDTIASRTNEIWVFCFVSTINYFCCGFIHTKRRKKKWFNRRACECDLNESKSGWGREEERRKHMNWFLSSTFSVQRIEYIDCDGAYDETCTYIACCTLRVYTSSHVRIYNWNLI